MGIEPVYGETPLEPDEAGALTPEAREAFGDQPKQLDLYEAEQAIADEVSTGIFDEIFRGALKLSDLLTDNFLRDLHRQLYGEIWTWAGEYRRRQLNIGIDPAYISMELRNAFDNIRYRWEHTNDWTPRELGVAVHAETVRIHGFVDGNGRATRLLADLVFFAAQDPEAMAEEYDWEVDKSKYIEKLREYDASRDPKPLAAFIQVRQMMNPTVEDDGGGPEGGPTPPRQSVE